MRVGVFTPLLSGLPLESVLKKLAKLEIPTVELGTGNYPGDAHCKLSMLENRCGACLIQEDARGSRIFDQRAELPRQSAASGRRRARSMIGKSSRKTILLAEKLGVPVVVDFSGCPGDSRDAKYPNWVTCPWPPEYLEMLALAVGRSGRALLDRACEVRGRSRRQRSRSRCIRASWSIVPETMLKLRAIAGPAIGCNYDPSHMFWQGIDPIAAIRVLGDAIFHVHAKDTQIYAANLPLTGVLDTKTYTDERNRAWIFRTCGYGHGAGGGGSSSRRCACSATTTCSPSSMRTA